MTVCASRKFRSFNYLAIEFSTYCIITPDRSFLPTVSSTSCVFRILIIYMYPFKRGRKNVMLNALDLYIYYVHVHVI